MIERKIYDKRKERESELEEYDQKHKEAISQKADREKEQDWGEMLQVAMEDAENGVDLIYDKVMAAFRDAFVPNATDQV